MRSDLTLSTTIRSSKSPILSRRRILANGTELIPSFFVAIPPTFRQEWGEQMTKLMKPGGYLVTVIYPLRPYDETGPPYYVEPEHYVPLLEPSFTKVLDKIPVVSSPSHLDKERIVVWRKLG